MRNKLVDASDNEKKEITFQGIQASPGIAIGTVLVIDQLCPELNIREKDLKDDEIEEEIERFRCALDLTRDQLQELQKRVQSKLEDREARIFDAHLLIVDDKMLSDEVETLVRLQKKPADFAFNKVVNRYAVAISSMEDPYIRERAADIKDVGARVLSNLVGETRPIMDHLPGQRIIISHDLTPSDTALLDRENVQAFAIESGSRTSHTAILARSMKIPAVVGIQDLLNVVRSGDLIIVDGFVGNVIVNPTDETLNQYVEKEEKEEEFFADLLKETRLRPETIDGFSVQLVANIDQLEDVRDAKNYGAVGIGLFRTEYMFINETTQPSEEEQFEVYRKLAVSLEGQPVIIRSVDLGGDKLSKMMSSHYEQNPFLGFRAIRYCLENEELLRTQVKAVLRASYYGDVKLMFPMVTCIEEVRQLKLIVEDEKRKLKEKSVLFDNSIEIGIMIEIPSAAIIADRLAREVDFFSIGTNDLVQYTMAVDRGNEKVAYLYQPTHPAILHLIKGVTDAARSNRIWVSVCGEMAGDPRYTPLLVGMGVHELSMSPVSIGPVRRIIRRLRMYEAEEVVAKAMSCSSAEEAMEISEELLYRITPDVMSLAVKGL